VRTVLEVDERERLVELSGPGLSPGEVVAAARAGARVELTAAAGEEWEPFVARCVAEGLAGVESLSGIPGSIGATPIQNVGAYGQEVADTITAVRAYDRQRGSRQARGYDADWDRLRLQILDRDHNGSKNILEEAFIGVGRHTRVIPEAPGL